MHSLLLIAGGSNAPIDIGVYGLFAGGYPTTASSPVATTLKYGFISEAMLAGSNLSEVKHSTAGIGNLSQAVYSGGAGASSAISNKTERYHFSDDVISAGTALATARAYLTAVGNLDAGIYAGGFITAATAVTGKYTFATDTMSASPALGSARYNMAGGGNSTLGIIAGSQAATGYTDRYTYSNDTVAAGVSMILSRHSLSAISTSTDTYLVGGIRPSDGALFARNERMNHAANTVTSTTAVRAQHSRGACSTPEMGVFVGGSGNSSTVVNATLVDKYFFADNTIASGTALASAIVRTCGVSTTPGGLS